MENTALGGVDMYGVLRDYYTAWGKADFCISLETLTSAVFLYTQA